MNEFEDGKYDVMIIDAEEGDNGVIALELVVSSGARRGDVMHVSATNLSRTWFELLAAPATLMIIDGQPHLELD